MEDLSLIFKLKLLIVKGGGIGLLISEYCLLTMKKGENTLWYFFNFQ